MTERVTVNAAQTDDGPHMPSWMDEDAVTYAQAGVDTAEGARAVEAIKGVVHDTYRPEVVGDIGGFGGLFSIAAAKDMDDPLLVSGTDGVGTKLKVAQMAGKHDTVGIDLVAMCANDILATGAEPLFFLDYVAIGKLKAENVAEIVAGIGEGCKQAGCALIGGEMAEHPGVMDPDDYDLSGFCVGVVDRAKMLDPAAVREGDVLIGLASSGLHSNGYSLARKVCVEGKTHYELRIEREELGGRSLQDALLEPTRIYVKPVRAVLEACEGAVHALAHITGGGISENLDRALPKSCAAEVDRVRRGAPRRSRGAQDVQHGPRHGAHRGRGARRRGGGRADAGRRDHVPRRPHRGGRGRGPLRERRQAVRLRCGGVRA